MTDRVSAGILLYRRSPGGGLEVLLGHPGGPFFAHKDLGAWSIPKGEVEPGEDLYDVARREFDEETGHPPPDAAADPARDRSSRRAASSSTPGRWKETWTRPPPSATRSRCRGRRARGR